MFQEFYALKRRCAGQDGNLLKCFCFVAVCHNLLDKLIVCFYLCFEIDVDIGGNYLLNMNIRQIEGAM